MTRRVSFYSTNTIFLTSLSAMGNAVKSIIRIAFTIQKFYFPFLLSSLYVCQMYEETLEGHGNWL